MVFIFVFVHYNGKQIDEIGYMNTSHLINDCRSLDQATESLVPYS